jgi:hypothetical protein
MMTAKSMPISSLPDDMGQQIHFLGINSKFGGVKPTLLRVFSFVVLVSKC